METREPQVAVILCTYNPRPDLLRWAASSVFAQTLSGFEFVIVDNNSHPAVRLDSITGLAPNQVPARIIREERAGLSHARVAGIRATTAPTIVFVDDDNYLDANYLDRASRIADEQPWIGAFGGRTRAVFETAISSWKRPLLAYLGVRDYGPRSITSTNKNWGEWEPIGAGMVCRRDVALRFAEWIETIPEAGLLGRSGREMMSGEDTLIAQAAYSLGYSCSYQPSLRLSHWMKSSRLSALTMARTVAGHGRSHVVLLLLKGVVVPRPSLTEASRELMRRYRKHLRDEGFGTGAIKWCWDLGYFQQARRTGQGASRA